MVKRILPTDDDRFLHLPVLAKLQVLDDLILSAQAHTPPSPRLIRLGRMMGSPKLKRGIGQPVKTFVHAIRYFAVKACEAEHPKRGEGGVYVLAADKLLTMDARLFCGLKEEVTIAHRKDANLPKMMERSYNKVLKEASPFATAYKDLDELLGELPLLLCTSLEKFYRCLGPITHPARLSATKQSAR